MAMDIIAKERKEISWRGLPSNSKDEVEALRVRHAVPVQFTAAARLTLCLVQHAHTMATRAVETKKEHLDAEGAPVATCFALQLQEATRWLEDGRERRFELRPPFCAGHPAL